MHLRHASFYTKYEKQKCLIREKNYFMIQKKKNIHQLTDTNKLKLVN